MSAGYGPPAVNTFGMITGIGDAIGRSYDAARKQAQEDEAPAIFSKLVGLQSPDAAPAPGVTLGTMGQSYREGAAAQPAKLPSFAGGGSAPMRVPGSGGEIETKFVDALKAGGLTNPFGLGAMAAYAGRESGYKGSNITGSWSDPSESGQPGTSGGILSWRGDRFANMRRLTAGAADPVTAQAKFALTENPELTLALQSAKSPEEANALMAQAWKFAGWNRQGGESAARLAATRAYVASLGGATPAAQGAAPQMATADRPMTMPGAPAAPGTVAQAPLPQMGTAAPAQVAASSTVAQGDPDAANKPAPNAQPAGFVIPGQDAPAAPAPTPQGFPGFGAAASRISPAQQEILTAAWKNPITRPMATAVYQQLLTGKASPWKMEAVNGVSSWVNGTTGQIVPVTGVGPRFRDVTDEAGNQFKVNDLTGERSLIVKADKPDLSNDQRNYQEAQRGGYGGSFTEFLDSQRRPLTPTVLSPGQTVLPPGEYAKPSLTVPDRDKSAESEAKLRGEFTKQLGSFNDVQDGYRRLIAATEQREANPNSISPASDIALVFGYMKMLDPGSVVREGEYATAQNAGGVDDKVRNLYNKAINGEFLSDGQRQDFIDTAGRLYGQARQGAESVASRYSDLAKGQGLDEGRVVKLPDALKGPKLAPSRADPAADGGKRALPEVVKGGRPPEGYTWDSYLAKSKGMLKDRPDLRPQLEDMLAKAGIDPRKLGK